MYNNVLSPENRAV